MLFTFVGQLMNVNQRTSKSASGYKYTVLTFNTKEGGTFDLSQDGHVEVAEKFLRKDIPWTVGVRPDTFNNVTRFKVISLVGDLKGDK